MRVLFTQREAHVGLLLLRKKRGYHNPTKKIKEKENQIRPFNVRFMHY